MEKQVIFRAYQEQQVDDHNNIQVYGRQSIDHVVFDAVTQTRRYAGFEVQKTGQAEVQVASGRFYDQDGGVYIRETTLTQSMITYLPALSKRIVILTAYGSEVETDTAEREFLVDVDTGRTEPDSVPMTSERQAVLGWQVGSESSDPADPTIPATNVGICRILLDTTQVVSVTMMTDNEVVSTEDLDERVDDVETFNTAIGPRVTSLAADLAALAKQVEAGSKQLDMTRIFIDLAELREKAKLPTTGVVNYGADYFLTIDHSDYLNGAGLGYDALVEEGLRFSPANEDEFEVSLFSANDPAATATSGLLLPKFTANLALSISTHAEDYGMAQVGYQTFNLKQNKIRKERLRYGGQYFQCSNGVAYWTVAGDNNAPWWLPDYETYNTVTQVNNGDPWHLMTYYDYWWHDSWTESYWTLETVDHSINGAQIAQSFLIANDMWAVQLGFYVTQKAAEENIIVDLCELTNGVPDQDKIILHQVHTAGNIVVGWNRISIVPTFLQRGKRYALMLTSNANHSIGMASGQSYLDGTFFYSTDGVYYQGDLLKDMMIEVWSAKFQSPISTIEFAPINLDGGLRNIDITAGLIVPESCQLIYEIRPNGTGEWLQLTPQNVTALNGAPPLLQFRGRFVGTRDIQPGLMMTGSRVYVSRPKTTFKHVSQSYTVTSNTKIHVRCVIENFDETPHDFTCQLRLNNNTTVNPSGGATVDTTLDANRKRIQRDFTFEGFSPAATSLRIILNGSTNSAASMFHCAESLFYCISP